MSFEESEAEGYRAIFGNPGELKLHEALSDIQDWLDYEAAVVEEAAAEIDDTEIADAAGEQAEAMEEAAEAVGEAADAARDTAAEVFSETGIATSENVGDGTPEGDAIGGNVATVPNFGPEKFSVLDGNIAEDAKTGFWYVVEETAFAPGRYEVVSVFPDRQHAEHWEKTGEHLKGVTAGNPVDDSEPIPTETVTEGNPVMSGMQVEPRETDEGWIVATRGGPLEAVVDPAGNVIHFATRADAENYIASDFNEGDFAVIEGNPGENPLPVETPDVMPEAAHGYFRPVNLFGRSFGGR